MVQWKTAQYLRTNITDVFAFPWTRALLERIFCCRSEAFAGELCALYAGDRLVAVHFGMRSYGVLHLWFPSYDIAWAKFSPGLIRDLELLQAAAARGIRRVDYGKGMTEQKKYFMSGASRVAEGSVDLRPLSRLGAGNGDAPTTRPANGRWGVGPRTRSPVPHPRMAGLSLRPGEIEMELPLISIIIPTFNRSEMLADALESLLRLETGGQLRYEIVVVDNGSTDATKEVVQRAAARSPMPVKYVYHEVHGDAPARNCGMVQAQGSWMAFFDDDQLAAPDWLLKLHQAAVETQAPVVGGAVRLDLPPEVLSRLGMFVRRASFRESEHCTDIHPYRGKAIPGCGNVLVAQAGIRDHRQFRRRDGLGRIGQQLFLAGAGGRHRLLLHAPRNNPPPHSAAPADHGIFSLGRAGRVATRWPATTSSSKAGGMLVLICLARIAQALVVDRAQLAWGWLRGDAGAVLGSKVRLWRAQGYVRRTLVLLAPACFPQTRYFDYLKFRRGRVIGQHGAKMEVAS